jgi:hypothetical protein
MISRAVQVELADFWTRGALNQNLNILRAFVEDPTKARKTKAFEIVASFDELARFVRYCSGGG